MTQTPTTAGCDTRDMRLVHQVFLTVFADGPALVAGVADGDRSRSTAVGEHLLDLAVALRRHHETEDELLWDDLSARAPACALHVTLMRNQHSHLAEVLVQVEDLLPAWIASASAADRDRLRGLMSEIDRQLREHLGDEERLILPVAERTLTQAEWDRLGEFARRESKPSMLFPQLGFMIDSLSPEEGDYFLRHTLPAPIRLAWRLVGVHVYRRHRARIYGPAESRNRPHTAH